MGQNTTPPEESTLVYVSDLSDYTAPATGADAIVEEITANGFYHWDGAKWVAHSTANDSKHPWLDQTDKVVLAPLLIDEDVQYIKEGGYRHIPRTLRNISGIDFSSGSAQVLTEPVSLAEINAHKYNLTYSDMIKLNYSGPDYVEKALSDDVLIIDANDDGIVKNFRGTGSNVVVNSSNSNNFSSLIGGSNGANFVGNGIVDKLTGMYNLSLLSSGTGKIVRGALDRAGTYSSGNITDMTGTNSLLSMFGSGNVTNARATLGLIDLGSGNTAINSSNNITNLATNQGIARFYNNYSGTITNLMGYEFSYELRTGATTPNVTNMYGLKIGNINLGTDANYSIYTESGIVRFGDKVGIGVDAPEAKLDVRGIVQVKSPTGSSRIFINAPENNFAYTTYAEDGIRRWDIGKDNTIEGGANVGSNFYIASFNDNGSAFVRNFTILRSSGNTGVGITNPTEKLEVAGNVKATTFIATGNGGGSFPDYVFEAYYNGESELNANYDFKSLDTVESFIKENGHLPGYTSAKEVAEAGQFDMTATQLTNVEKIEELYLHTIAQEAKIEKQAQEIAELKLLVNQLINNK